jgi:hypothetical protein
VAAKQSRTTTFFHSSLFAVFGSRIRDKHSGSATLKKWTIYVKYLFLKSLRGTFSYYNARRHKRNVFKLKTSTLPVFLKTAILSNVIKINLITSQSIIGAYTKVVLVATYLECNLDNGLSEQQVF